MPESRLKVLLIGEEAAGIQALRALAGRREHLVAVMASPANATRSGACLWTVARQMGYPVWPAVWVKDFEFGDRLRAEGIDLVLNVHSLYIMHPRVLAAPRIGSFNLHPGPLPEYAGLNTVSWAIYHGETQYGVTLHEMTPAIDAGHVAYQARFPIQEIDSPLSLMMRCIRAGIPLVLQLLEAASRDPHAIPLTPQDLSKRKYFGKEVPNGGRIRWDGPAQAAVNFVRACDYQPFPSPWGHPRARLGDQEVQILKASRTGVRCEAAPGTVGTTGDQDATVACADEWITIRMLRVGGRTVAPEMLLRRGDRLESGIGTPAPPQ